MKKIGFIFVLISFLSIIFASQLKLLSHPVQEYDEGVYLTTFLLIDNGHPAYKETFLSQPPGFLLSIYPGFILLGKSLQAARLTIGIWSLIGLLAIVWLCIELKNKWAGIFALGILYLIPYYFNQTLVFHSDLLIGTFSLIILASIFRYLNTKHLRWFLFATIFLNLTFWTKFDFFLFPAIIVIFFSLIKSKQISVSNIYKLISIFTSVSLIFFLIFIMPFGIQYVLKDTLGLRLSAGHLMTQPPLLFITYIKQNLLLMILTLTTLALTFLRKDNFRYPLLPLLVWTFTIFLIFLFYNPLFIHHLAIFTIPLVVYFSLSTIFWLKKKTTFYPLIIFCFLIAALISYLFTITKQTSNLLTLDEQTAVKIINQNALPNDLVVSDNEMLNGISNKLPPAELSDISYVRIASQDLSSKKFKQIINTNQPKLIIPWNGRLTSIADFADVLKQYRPLAAINHKVIYIRID